MIVNILRDMAAQIQSSPFLTMIADASNTEQVTLFIHWVTDNTTYCVPLIAADLLMRMNLSFGNQVCGLHYDRASATSGERHGVAKQISDIEPRAVFTHCYGHALNLAASDTIKKSDVMKEALETKHEITKLI